jgi:hypothetical protein
VAVFALFVVTYGVVVLRGDEVVTKARITIATISNAPTTMSSWSRRRRSGVPRSGTTRIWAPYGMSDNGESGTGYSAVKTRSYSNNYLPIIHNYTINIY